MKIEDLPEKYQKQARNQLAGRKKPKYGNIKTIVDDIKFDSRKEANYFAELKVRVKAGEITDLILQPRFLLQESFDKNGQHYRKIEYIADFQYTEAGKTIVVDTKGKRTDVYKLKRKLFEKRYPDLTIKEV